jgi:hypothetical protein
MFESPRNPLQRASVVVLIRCYNEEGTVEYVT